MFFFYFALKRNRCFAASGLVCHHYHFIRITTNSRCRRHRLYKCSSKKTLHHRLIHLRISFLTSGQLNYPRDDDDEEGQQLGVGEDVLHGRGPLHLENQNIFNIKIFFKAKNTFKIRNSFRIRLLSTDLVTVDEGEDTDADGCQQSE